MGSDYETTYSYNPINSIRLALNGVVSVKNSC